MFQALAGSKKKKSISYASIIILSGKAGNYQLLNEGLSMQNGGEHERKT
jgi:hypothetical protein